MGVAGRNFRARDKEHLFLEGGMSLLPHIPFTKFAEEHDDVHLRRSLLARAATYEAGGA